MIWFLLLFAVAAFVVWDFRRFQAKKRVEHGQPDVDPQRVRDVVARSDRAAASGDPISGVRAERHSASDKPSAVRETVSVVLRRQVPPRDEPSRSWLGGLPMMPADVEWPRSVSSEYPQRGQRPLHFVAQIACADLPSQLWGGLGPRTGWLLFFVDPNQGVPEERDAFRVMHVDELGVERPAPDDLGPVHDGVYTGPSYDYVASPEDVPTTWRRWPVDLVVVPNEARVEGQRTLVAPENFASQLYEGEPVSTDFGRPNDPEPFTWRGALYVLNGLERSLARPWRKLSISDAMVQKLARPG